MRVKWFLIGAVTASVAWWLALNNVGGQLLSKIFGAS